MELAMMKQASNLVVADGEEIKISGRELHMLLEVVTPYHKWFPRMVEYGFTEGTDFSTVDKNVRRADGALMPQTQHDHEMTVDMAKEISMLQRSEKGKQARQYFIQLEKDWNSPEKVMARALNIAKKTLATVSIRLDEANKQLEEQKPMVVFANAVTASSTSILVGELAKLLKQNGFNFGQNRLFDWLRNNGYLMKSGCSRNMPTQRAMELGLFEVKETSVATPYGTRLNRTTKITGKGQIYFINKFKGMQGALV